MNDENYGNISADSQRVGWILSLLGTVPFISFAIVLLANIDVGFEKVVLVHALTTYAAIILSFLGGIRWGIALTSPQGRSAKFVFLLAVLPSLIGWFCLFLDAPLIFALLIVAFFLQLIWDYGAWCTEVMQEWFVKLRIAITGVVVVSLAIAFFATLQH